MLLAAPESRQAASSARHICQRQRLQRLLIRTVLGPKPTWPRSHFRRDAPNHRSATNFCFSPRPSTGCVQAVSVEMLPVISRLGPRCLLVPAYSLSFRSTSNRWMLLATIPVATVCRPMLNVLAHNLRQSTLTRPAFALLGGLDVQ